MTGNHTLQSPILSKDHEPSLQNTKAVDQVLLFLIALLVVFGMMSLYSACQPFSLKVSGSAYALFLKQLIFIVFGIAGMWIFAKLDDRMLLEISTPLYFIALLILVLVFSNLGVRINGARRWLHFGPMTFAPAIIVHLTTILYLAKRLSSLQPDEQRSFYSLSKFFALVWIPVVLIAVQPNFSDALVLVVTATVLIYIAGFRLVYLAITSILILLPIVYFLYSAPYRMARISSFMSPIPSSRGWQLSQSLIAIGSGGIAGIGYGNGLAKYGYVPDVHSAFIYANICEEYGLIGALAVLLLFGLMIARCTLIAIRTQGISEKLLAYGISFWLAFQILFNISSVIGLLPIAGLQLPFFSYGGSRTIIDFCALGILLRLSSNTGKYRNYYPYVRKIGSTVYGAVSGHSRALIPKVGDIAKHIDGHPLYIILAIIGLLLTILASGIQLLKWFILKEP